MATTSDPMVPLRGGPCVPTSLVVRMVAMEDRGARFRIEPDGRLHVGPRAAVTADDLAFCRQHRDLVLACVAYIDRQCEAPL